MASARPILLLVAAGPNVGSAATLLERAVDAARGGTPVSVLLSHEGLAWAADPRLATAARLEGLDVAVCSANARDAGWTLDTTPPFVAWSALVAWLRDVGPDQPLWTALP